MKIYSPRDSEIGRENSKLKNIYMEVLHNICVPCKDVSVLVVPSDWFNNELNGQYLGRKR